MCSHVDDAWNRFINILLTDNLLHQHVHKDSFEAFHLLVVDVLPTPRTSLCVSWDLKFLSDVKTICFLMQNYQFCLTFITLKDADSRKLVTRKCSINNQIKISFTLCWQSKLKSHFLWIMNHSLWKQHKHSLQARSNVLSSFYVHACMLVDDKVSSRAYMFIISPLKCIWSLLRSLIEFRSSHQHFMFYNIAFMHSLINMALVHVLLLLSNQCYRFWIVIGIMLSLYLGFSYQWCYVANEWRPVFKLIWKFWISFQLINFDCINFNWNPVKRHLMKCNVISPDGVNFMIYGFVSLTVETLWGLWGRFYWCGA